MSQTTKGKFSIVWNTEMKDYSLTRGALLVFYKHLDLILNGYCEDICRLFQCYIILANTCIKVFSNVFLQALIKVSV